MWPALAGFVAEGRGDVTLAEPDAAQQDDVGFLFDEREAEQVFDLEFVDLFGPVPAELIKGLHYRESGGVEAAFDGALLAGAVFAFDQAAQIFDVRPAFRGGVGGEGFALGGDVGEFQIREVCLQNR